MSDSEIKQLLEMGASRAQAVAALSEKKEVMEAAEAIFDGKYDHLKEDQDRGGDGNRDEEDEEMPDFNSDDDQGSDAFDDDDDDDDGGVGDMDDILEPETSEIDNDPYANIEMSKDRVEEVIEVEEDAKTYKIKGRLEPRVNTASGSSSSSTVSSSGALVDLDVEQMTRSEWMKGYSEGSENSHLFSIFQSLTEPSACPSCSTISPQAHEPSSILLLFPTFHSLIEHLDQPGVISANCSKCSTHFCRGCKAAIKPESEEILKNKGKKKMTDEDLLDDASQTNGNGKSSNKKSTTAEYEKLRRILHCGALQSAVIGIGLAQVERLFADHPSNVRKMEKENAGGKRDTTNANGDDSSNRGANRTKIAAGTGYGGAGTSDFAWQKVAAEKQKKEDQAVQIALEGIRYYLPSHGRELDPFGRGSIPPDWMVDISAIAHIRRRFLPLAGKLLATDSLSDMLDRKDLYNELFEWMRTFASHEALGALLAQPLMLPRKTEYRSLKNGKREKIVTFEGSEGPRELTESIVKQCKTLLETNDKEARRREIAAAAAAAAAGLEEENEEDENDEEIEKSREAALRAPPVKEVPRELTDDEKLIEFCRSIIRTTESIDTALRRTKGAGFIDRLLNAVGASSNAISSQISSKKVYDLNSEEQISFYEKWAKSEAFGEADMTLTSSSTAVDEEKIHYRHALDSLIQSAYGTDNAKRSLIISKELASLRVSLPSLFHGSIWLRVDESRVDVLKACVAGPEGSPYDSGLFMFDIFLPGSYNSTPPSVKIITTKGGQYRYNPNLYAEGKVCLSLLGTWSGPGWVAGKSTLLQVLLSIQSLVMGVEEPCINEPGWESQKGSEGSFAYTKNNRRQTAEVAILGNLIDPPAPWKSVVEGYFKNKGPSIIKLLDKWLEEDDGRPTVGDGATYMNSAGLARSANPTQAAASLAAVRAAFPPGKTAGSSDQIAVESPVPATKFGKDVLEIRKRIVALMED